ncbi:hypothetical protein AGABI2DRAFT_146038 [Agaricus bisporus var. bisporus H97]|uniref:hypothetical protein n=1 Tax=Agaricus bisporus var. bisporus (strain H97 / ATCC MYA-4626 / FGSC 10389) TaxID=936046 RepID=UPI00029F64A2|nr:hypothetical protein AGABI2DRAFT_146038 [Agaricus bisporus var. bisporus H97]EKV43109.1 hypothetical protein AGABI2DRAFT_146038 [Agaricus bisporus var. bisporus H97]
MLASRRKQSQPASAPHPSRPLSQAPPPPANLNSSRLPLNMVELYQRNTTLTLSALNSYSLENRAIVDAVRNRGIATAVTIANAEARALAKGNVKGPSGQPPGIVAAPPAVKTTPRAPPPSSEPHNWADPPPSPPPRAPSPAASVLSKRSQRLGSTSSGPSVAAVSVRNEDDSSMALDYEAITPRPGSPNEPVDNKQTVMDFMHTIDSLLDVLSLLAEADWRKDLLKDIPTLMDNELNDVYNHFKNGIQKLAPSLLLECEQAVYKCSWWT